jgi:hypothetical protein
MRERKLYTNSDYCEGFGSVGPDAHGTLWSSHTRPCSTRSHRPVLHDDIRVDLLCFVRRREHYARVGHA